MTIAETPSQTVGPYLHIALDWPDGPHAVPPGTPGAVRLRGRLTDGAGLPVGDGLVETWQADPAGRFDHPDDPRGAVAGPDGFRGFARCPTDSDGRWEVLTLKPGPQQGPGSDEVEAPHVDVSVFARGLLQRLVTRLYFADEESANAADPVLRSLPHDGARATLIAAREDDGGGTAYVLDIRLQGDDETVFFTL